MIDIDAVGSYVSWVINKKDIFWGKSGGYRSNKRLTVTVSHGMLPWIILLSKPG